MFIISHSFCGPGIWERRSWVVGSVLHSSRGCSQEVGGLQVFWSLASRRMCFHHGSLVCLTGQCWWLAGRFRPLLYRLHKAAWELSRHGKLASSKGSCPRGCKTEATMSSNWALEVTVISSVLCWLPGQPDSVWTPGGKNHWSRLRGWLSQEYNLWNPSPPMISNLPSLICEMGVPA